MLVKRVRNMVRFLSFALLILPCLGHGAQPESDQMSLPFRAHSESSTAKDSSNKLIHFPLGNLPSLSRNSRRRLSSSNSNGNAPLFQGIGTHYVDLYVGTPVPQKQTLIVDTGSEWTAFPCVPDCCGQHADSEFNTSFSETFIRHERSCGLEKEPHQQVCAQPQTTQCSNDASTECLAHMNYMEGSSWNAYEAIDEVTLMQDVIDTQNNASSFPLRFGCQTSTTKLFRTQLADGITGFDDSPLAFWKQAGVDSFSLCFNSPIHGNMQDQAGVMSLGGYEEDLHASGMEFAKRTRGTKGGRFYSVEVRDLSFNRVGDAANDTSSGRAPLQGFDSNLLNRGGVIIDSGTTDTYLPASAGSVFRASFRDLTGMHWSNTLQVSLEQAEKFPTLLFHLAAADANSADVMVEFPPLHYLDTGSQEGMFEPALFFEGTGTVLGANFIRGHNVHFSTDTIGFAPSTCDYGILLDNVSSAQHSQPESIKLEVKETTDGDGPSFFMAAGIMLVVAVLVAGVGVRRNNRQSQQYPMFERVGTSLSLEDGVELI